MELKWTSKALSDLARLYEFLSTVNQPAAARTRAAADVRTDHSADQPAHRRAPGRIRTRETCGGFWSGTTR